MTTYGITGATGQLGRLVVAALARRVGDDAVVALVRDPAKAAALGVAARPADYGDRPGLVDAFTGIDTLLLISSNALQTRRAEHANVIEAAKAAHVRRIVYTSLLHADRWGIDFAEDHLQTERSLRASGLDFTVLRNGWYWENHTAGLSQALAHGGLRGSAGDARISWASRSDYADAAARVLSTLGHAGITYELAGDHAWTLDDLAGETVTQSGRPFVYQDLAPADYAAFLETAGLTPPLAAMLAQIDRQGVATGVLADDSGTLSTLIGRPTTPLHDAVAQALSG